MALNSNALTSRAALVSYMRTPIAESDLIAVYGLSTLTTATVEVDSAKIILTANGTPTNYTFATYTTISTMVAAINQNASFVARAVGNIDADSSYIAILASTNCKAVANETFLRGVDYAAVDAAINAASAQISSFTGREFVSAMYYHRFCGANFPTLQLKYYPVSAIARVAIGRRGAIRAKYTSTTASDATISVTSTSVVLRSYGTTTTTTTITISTNTMSQLVTLIAATSGWSAELDVSDATSWQGTELLVQSPVGCLNENATLYAPEHTVQSYDVDLNAGTLWRRNEMTTPYTAGWYLNRPPQIWQSHIATTTLPGGSVWPAGQFNIYVEYTAGYSTIPADLQQICHEISANILRSGARDLTLKGESALGYSWSGNESVFNDSHRKRLGMYKAGLALPNYVDA